ncbi:MAG: T9SS type A sorting domain-containing protein [Chlorobi bacterium]|nr:T9SS type A sorting domain-containing protein [Chlorobiota bacterium]
MKHLLSLIILVVASFTAVYSQSDNILYRQDFENYNDGDMLMIDNDGLTPHLSGMETWKVEDGVAKSSSWYDDGDKTADDWMITPIINLGSSPAVIWDAKALDAQYSDGYQVLISTDVDHPDNLSAYTVLFEVSAEETSWKKRGIDLSNYAGKPVRLAWRNNSTDKYLLYVDNIVVYNRVDLSMAIEYTNLSDYTSAGSKPFTVGLTNYGTNKITTVMLSFTVDGENLTNEVFNTDVEFGQTISLSCSNPVVLNRDSIENVKVWISGLNSQNDQWNNDDTLTKKVSVYAKGAQNMLLIEHFTQASCAPCASQNPALNELMDQNSGKVAHIAYHTSWPGKDPMYDFNPEDSKARVSFYGVTGVPHVVLDGVVGGAPSIVTQSSIDNEYKQDGLANIEVSRPDRSSFEHFEIKVIPVAYALSPFKLYVVWTEDKSYYIAPGTNGETYFPDVMRKMLPTSDGILITPAEFKIGDTLTYNIDYQIPSEVNYENSELVIFLQDTLTKEVYMTSTAKVSWISKVDQVQLNKIKVYPNPASDYLTISTNGEINNAQIEIYSINGKLIKKDKFSSSDNYIDISSLPEGIYLLRIKCDNKYFVTKFSKL